MGTGPFLHLQGTSHNALLSRLSAGPALTRKRAMSEDTIELNLKVDNFKESISQTIVAALGSGMAPRKIIAQLIARGFLRDPGNNALEAVVQTLEDMAKQMRR
jgi:hypothetical protein